MAVEIPLSSSITKKFMAEPNALENLVVEPIKVGTLYHPVEYYGRLTIEKRAPYNFRINEAKMAQYLIKEFNFTAENFEKLRVHVIGEAPAGKPYGFTQKEKEFFFDSEMYGQRTSLAAIREDEDGDGTQHIIFYAFNFWRALIVERAAILRFAKMKRKSKESKNRLDEKTDFLEKSKERPKLGRRFDEYLDNILPDAAYEAHVRKVFKDGLKPDKKIPLSKAVPFINRFIFNRMAKIAMKDKGAIHETSHSFQYRVLWKRIVKQLGNDHELIQKVLDLMAEADEIRLSKKPEWIGIVEFDVLEPDKIYKLRMPPPAIKIEEEKEAA